MATIQASGNGVEFSGVGLERVEVSRSCRSGQFVLPSLAIEPSRGMWDVMCFTVLYLDPLVRPFTRCLDDVLLVAGDLVPGFAGLFLGYAPRPY